MASFLLPSAFLASPVAAQLTLCFTILVLILILAGDILFRSKNKPPVLPSVRTGQDSDYRSAIAEGDHLVIARYIRIPESLSLIIGQYPSTQIPHISLMHPLELSFCRIVCSRRSDLFLKHKCRQ
jgi:hypothetical protein